jgi:Ser-tRNA(Ala) deacylase AlaX
MTNKLFWEDPYLTQLETVVESVDRNTITLQDTIFYAFSGAQESDTGTIGGYPVVEAEKIGFKIFYELPEGHKLKPGDQVEVKIDWERRYRLMRLHFATELVLELAYQQLDGIEKIGAHIAADKARLDFLWPESIKPHLAYFAAQAQALVDQDIEIISAYTDRKSEQRYWEVPGFARVSCGGTHLKRTGEIGQIGLKRNNIGKGKERIEIFVPDT